MFDVYDSCVACSGELVRHTARGYISRRIITTVICRRCGGLHFAGSRADALELVRFDKMKPEASSDESMRYFDVTLPEEESRIHGWFDTADGLVVQFG